MIKKRNISSIIKAFLALSAVIAACLAFAFIGSPDKTYAKEEWNEVSLKEVYEYGATLDIPSRAVKIGGEEVAAWHTVTYPDGKTVNQSAIKLDAMGDYVVNYYAEKNGKSYGDSLKFTVKGVAYRFTGEKSGATYGKYDKFGANSVGLNVRLAYKETLEFTHTIDVSKLTSADDIVEGFITPDDRGVYDFTKLIFVLTDAEDESVYLRFHINKHSSAENGLSTLFVSAGGNGQDMVGWENDEPGKNPHVNDNLGQYITGSFVAQQNKNGWSGEALDFVPDTRPFTLSYDASTLTVKAQTRFVSTLDDPKYYTKALWHGFPSGKAKLSVSASGYNSETANFCITKVYGITGEYLKENLYTDNEGPLITVNADYSEMPDAERGGYYPIPQATAFDAFSGACNVKVGVYVNYGAENQISIGVEDGKFKVNKLGYYVIEYTAEDVYGNSSKKLIYVRSVAKTADVNMEMPQNPVSEIELGSVVEFGRAIVSGGSGEVTLKITARCGDDVYEIENYEFRFETAGEYTVTYTATDYIGKSVSKSYKLTAVAADKPLFIDEIVLPRIFISDSAFVLPEYYANDYTSGKAERKLCSIKVIDANGEKIYKSGEEIVPKVANNGDFVTLIYFCGDAEKEVKVPAIIAKYGENRIYMNNYIYGDVTTSTRDENNKLYSEGIAVTPENAEKSGWLFANALSTDFAEFSIKSAAGKSFGTIEAVAYDRVYGNRGVKVTFAFSGDTVTATHAGKSVSFTAQTSDKEIKFSCSDEKITFSISGVSVGIDLVEYENGEAFEGFPSGRVYFGMNTVNFGDTYFVTSVCGKMLSYRNRDVTTPSILLVGDYGGRKKFGDLYTVKRALFGGVFAPDTVCSVTVYAPDNSIAKDIYGVTLKDMPVDKEYYIKLTEYGSYNITYTATDVNWVNEDSGLLIDNIYVPDETAPTIKFDSTATAEATVGSVIVMPNYTVSDNVTAAENITVKVFVINSAGRIIPLGEGSNSLKAEYSGKYRFVVYAVDEEGNAATAEYTVEVR